MIDLRALEKDFDTIATRLQTKGVEEKVLAELKELFEEYKKEKTILQELQTKQNSLSKMFGQYKREGKDINELKNELEINKGKIAAHQEVVRDLEEKLKNIALTIPNPPDPDVPVGENEEDNVVLKTVLEPKGFDFEPKEHWELGEKLGWIDFERGVKLAKSRFSVLKKEAARLERALINFMLDHNKEYGFEEVCVPFMANSATLLGTGQLPKFEEDLFKICDEDLYMIPTAEVPLTNLYRDEIIKDLEDPIKLTAYTPCFRKEAGSGGRDVRGMIRQHQFDKVELVAITRPEESDKVFDEMVKCASSLLAKLGLPHRHVMLCTGDLGFSAAKTIDLEVWLPGQGKYREISSISNTRDFQARRAQIRFKDGKKNRLVHTLNGSSLAVGRTLIAIMENYQQKDGSIAIPKVLESYL
ncbi:serine--tRNA ligase [Nitratiruptor sp. SB155-2]|uniref:Serine--tRNA ligase n=1 Tax=Nitratiruptor sp. (strain SB155-2) TaxID=387092 RepID=SYS_NITSB|nr:serine--tRNA ligase [Nitratiruptor sp. SB155-2]A6Q4S8.1 RecName: Full=Serine--tRNA ligase; AltName: Full=Seryl-tRNA synthetase; Short=SerRS; AltName: Full=Seryl-tRNA(Ser/Sec) synthetase [Nitratiruptor sp. SB155-2]BAF70487.1 seryl-tRNA synthetase [Nitratiruptor sp. SB155-2]